MESGEIEDPKDIREESDRLPEAIVDRPTTGRYYECTFCKQGFSTAQALGGHMNIHRRDRARIRQQTLPLVPNNPDDNHPNSAFQLQHHMPNHPLYHFPPSEAMRNYHVHRPSSSWSTSGIRRTFHGDSPSARVQRLDLNAEPSFQNPQARQLRDGEEIKDEEDGGLDLELRLGHEP